MIQAVGKKYQVDYGTQWSYFLPLKVTSESEDDENVEN